MPARARSEPLALALWFAAGLAACKATPSTLRLSCDQVSVDGVSLSSSFGPGVDFDAGEYELQLDVDGIRSSCRFRVVAGSRTPDCSGSVQSAGNCFDALANLTCGPAHVSIGRGLTCDVPNQIGSATGRCQPVEGVTERIELRGTPARLSLEQRTPSGRVNQLSVEPAYTTLEPNGPGRTPICHIARESRQWL